MKVFITEKQYKMLENNVKEPDLVYSIVRDLKNEKWGIKLIDQNEHPPLSGSKRFKDKTDAENFLKIINGIKQIKR